MTRDSASGVESPVILGEGLLRLLRLLAGERGCVLVLEDLHWADPESLAVLEYLADNMAGERIVCLGTVLGLGTTVAARGGGDAVSEREAEVDLAAQRLQSVPSPFSATGGE